MNLQDAVAVPWMAKFTRNVWPKKVVWLQDDRTHDRFYWLQVNKISSKAGDEWVASIQDGAIVVEKSAASEFRLLLSDSLLDLDKPVTIKMPEGESTTHSATRTIAAIAQSLLERNDPASAYSATIAVGGK